MIKSKEYLEYEKFSNEVLTRPEWLVIEARTFIKGYEQAFSLHGVVKSLRNKYKTDFDQWKITNGYVKDLKHKCYFKGDIAYFDFDLIDKYDKEIMTP
tara:strand:+ start:326 stop:619 length:294 start_codon:yes stop_codon:yes gene_type:complete